MSLTHERLSELLFYNPKTGVFTWGLNKKGGSNNRISNLREANQVQNNANSVVQGKVRLKEVSWNKRTKKFVSQIMENGKRKHLGYFNVAEEAARVYQEAALRIHGEFAYNQTMETK